MTTPDQILDWYNRVFHGSYAPGWNAALYPWQLEWAIAHERAVYDCRHGLSEPLTLILQVSRQGGKNEVSARTTLRQALLYRSQGGKVVKTAPSYQPQLLISKDRLTQVFSSVLHKPAGRNRLQLWRWSEGNILHFGKFELHLVSGDPEANKEGKTASLWLEVDEAQKFDPTIFSAAFRPMLAAWGAPTILMGSCWTRHSFLQQQIELARHRQKKLGRRLLFQYPWEIVANYNRRYATFVLAEREELGEDNPIFRSQYCLVPIDSAGLLFTGHALALLQGNHLRRTSPHPDAMYVAGVDLCGSHEQPTEAEIVPDATWKRDSTVVTVAELRWRFKNPAERDNPENLLPILRIVDHLHLKGEHPMSSVDRLFRYLFQHWRCIRVAVDGTGVGDAVARLLETRRPGQVEVVKATRANTDAMGQKLLAAVHSRRFTVYRPPADQEGLRLHREFFLQFSHCQKEVTAEGRLRFFGPTEKVVGPDGIRTEIHDDFVKSAALCVWAAQPHLYSQYQRPSQQEPVYRWGRGYA